MTETVTQSIMFEEHEGLGINQDDTLVPPPLSWFCEDEDEKDEAEGHQHTTSLNSQSFQHVLSEQGSSELAETYATQESEICVHPHPQLQQISTVGAPRRAPGWKELSTQVLPAAARELLSSSMQRIIHTARLSYAKSRWHRNYSDIGNPYAGYFRSDLSLPAFSSLPWVDRQLVEEWRTITASGDDDDEEEDFEKARTLVPQTMQRPQWQRADFCQTCQKPFGPSLLRHHCRLCGKSFCHPHSSQTHKLPHLGYDPHVPERVCLGCKHALNEQNLAERVAWRMARCRDYLEGELSPYFETGVDTVEDAALRITQAAIGLARSIPLGAQAQIAVETVEVLRKHGLKGIYGLILRKEFLAAADLLCRACEINHTTFPLSVHELSAAIFYALAQHRAVRGMNPEREHLIHSFREASVPRQRSGEEDNSSSWTVPRNQGYTGTSESQSLVDETDLYDPHAQSVTNLIALADAAIKVGNFRESESPSNPQEKDLPFQPVCDPVSDEVLSSCLFYAPIALNFIYVEREVDMQLLAAQQGWRLLYAHLDHEPGIDRPGSALFIHEERKLACFAVRGTATVSDVVTDAKQLPVPFPEDTERGIDSDDWTPVSRGQGLAVCGMARAAVNLFRENIDVLTLLARQSFRIRIVGHSLGGAVATLLGTLVKQEIEAEIIPGNTSRSSSFVEVSQLVRVYGYASPSCVDAKLSDYQQSFVTTIVLHDDVVPRLSPTSIRGLVKHLLHIRETWVQMHMQDDLVAIAERARTVWAPRWRSGFTLSTASGFCRKQIRYGKKKLLSVKGSIERQISSTNTETDLKNDDEIFIEDDEVESSDVDKAEDDKRDDPKLIVEYLGGVDKTTVRTIIDGEEFFDTEDNLLETDRDVYLACEDTVDSEQQQMATQEEGGVWNETDAAGLLSSEKHLNASMFSEPALEDQDELSSAVMLDETPLPRMFLPGKVIHIYTHRGGYKAAFVPRTFKELRRICTAGNMLKDHTCKAYFDALLEVQSVRNATEGLPRWTAFDEDVTCSCCASRFTWASTSDSEAQEARDKHNCRSCGTLVCDPCSKNRIPLPSVGLIIPSRVCDRCYHDMNGGTEAMKMTDSFILEDENQSNIYGTSHMNKVEQKERSRHRRSVVVDELASQIHSTVAVHN